MKKLLKLTITVLVQVIFYRVPIHSTVEQVNNYIESLPNEDDPELFNMHSNANLMYLKAKSGLIIDTILSV
jgi:dynein heavy chain, axonemal